MKSNLFLIENEILRYILRKTAEKSGCSFQGAYYQYKNLIADTGVNIDEAFDIFMHFSDLNISYLFRVIKIFISGGFTIESFKDYFKFHLHICTL